MMINNKFLWGALFVLWLTSCVNENTNSNKYPSKAPLYWSAYEYCYLDGGNGGYGYIPEEEWKKNIDWVADSLKPYGYDMVCIDGWGDVNSYNENGYRTKHSSTWNNDYAWWANYLKDKEMTLGIYQNPLWVNKEAANDGLKIAGTDISIASIIDTTEASMWFTWVQVDRPGAEEYVKGYIQYYADMGVSYLRVDFISWFEDGVDRNEMFSVPNPQRTNAQYRKALRWMKEACDNNNMTFSIVMPHLYEHAKSELESAGGSLIRINDDVCDGGWLRLSEMSRGICYPIWPTYHNTFDGFIHWSDIAGLDSDKMILDGDFTRIHTFANDAEKRTAISLQLIAGGPIAATDCYNSIGNNLSFYTNREMLELNRVGFVGSPLSTDPLDEDSQIWTGEMPNGDWIVALFNREDESKFRTIELESTIGFTKGLARDLWEHKELGEMEHINELIEPHGCRVYRIRKSEMQ